MGPFLEVHAARKAQITIESELQHLYSVYIGRKGFNVVLVYLINRNKALNEIKKGRYLYSSPKQFCQK
jgi:hypothetical protein